LDYEEWDRLYTYKGLPVKLRRDAEHELDEIGVLLEDVILGIKAGEPCPRYWRDRRDGHYEICFKFGGKIIRVVYIDGCVQVN
jgi:hypothetical protein